MRLVFVTVQYQKPFRAQAQYKTYPDCISSSSKEHHSFLMRFLKG